MGKTRRARTKYHISSVQGDLNISPTESKFLVENDLSKSNSSEKNILFNEIKINENDSMQIQLPDDLTINRSMDTNEEKCDTSKVNKEASDRKVVLEDDLFKNVNIVFDELVPLTQVDNTKPSNISISKCIKRTIAESGTNVLLRKEDKRELRRNLFIKKIDAIHQKVHKKTPKKSKGINSTTMVTKPTLMKEITPDKVNLTASEFPELPKLPKTKHLSDNSVKISKRKQNKAFSSKAKKQQMLHDIECFKSIISDVKFTSDALGFITDAVQRKLYSDV